MAYNQPFYYLQYVDTGGHERIGKTYNRRCNAEREAKHLALLGYTDIHIAVYK